MKIKGSLLLSAPIVKQRLVTVHTERWRHTMALQEVGGAAYLGCYAAYRISGMGPK